MRRKVIQADVDRLLNEINEMPEAVCCPLDEVPKGRHPTCLEVATEIQRLQIERGEGDWFRRKEQLEERIAGLKEFLVSLYIAEHGQKIGETLMKPLVEKRQRLQEETAEDLRREADDMERRRRGEP